MTKSKTILAGLGVVAALGTAALPLASYATQTQQSVSGNVDLYVEVQPAIAMTITGNNDDNGKAGATGTNEAVSVKNPTEATKIGTTDISSFATTAVKASSSYAQILPNSVVTGEETDSTKPGYGFKSTITVYTNSKAGYVLTVKDSDNTTALTKDTTGEDPAVSATIPAGASLEAGTAAWAFKGGLGIVKK